MTSGPAVRVQRRRKAVLFLPSRVDPSIGDLPSADLLPLELLHIAPMAERLGWEVVLVDAMTEPDYLEQVLSACEGADLFGSSCILGYQVWDGAMVGRAVRERFPRLPMIWGGWFPSAIPQLYLSSTICDAVCIGQGELVFEDVLKAIEAAGPRGAALDKALDGISGLAVMREGQLVSTGRRATVHLNELPEPSFHLIELQKYYDLQRRTATFGHRVRNKLPSPHHLEGRSFRGFSYFSSFGCPEPCSFCCSPELAGRRWVALDADVLVDRLAAIHAQDPFDVLRFQDANFGVAKKRMADFCQGLLDKGPEHLLERHDRDQADLPVRPGHAQAHEAQRQPPHVVRRRGRDRGDAGPHAQGHQGRPDRRGHAPHARARHQVGAHLHHRVPGRDRRIDVRDDLPGGRDEDPLPRAARSRSSRTGRSPAASSGSPRSSRTTTRCRRASRSGAASSTTSSTRGGASCRPTSSACGRASRRWRPGSTDSPAARAPSRSSCASRRACACATGYGRRPSSSRPSTSCGAAWGP
jgi:hypothetical protein